MLPALLRFLVAVTLAPLFGSIIVRTKALFAGRCGAPLVQPYRDLVKLIRKGVVYSHVATSVFRWAPVVSAAAVMAAMTLLPMAGARALLAFPGDFILLVYLLGVMRFATVLGALDSGSSFEGMGASREVQLAALSEPALMLSLVALSRQSGSFSLTELFHVLSPASWQTDSAGLALVATALFVVLLAEAGRIPVDDPTTHLELTMIHEVMVLDNSGPDLALVEVGAMLRLWLLAALEVAILVPIHTGSQLIDAGAFLAGMAATAVAIGVVESIMARLRLARVPQMLVGASVLAVVGLLLAG